MVKLVVLSGLVAQVALLNSARMRVLENVLRKAGLVTRHAAEMKPSDATNMILGALHQGAATEADIGVKNLRSLELDYLEIYNLDEDSRSRRVPSLDADIHLPSSIPVPQNLGEALDWLFSKPEVSINPYDEIELSQIAGWTEVRLSISDPKWFDGCDFESDAKRWSLGFVSHHPTGHRYTTIRTTRIMNPGLNDIARLIAGLPLYGSI